MSKRCYYEVLSVERTASVEDIKGAYRKAAKEHHPDRNHGDDHAEVRFKEVSEAYEVLKDDQKRAAYDRFGHAAFEQGNGGQRGGGNPFDFAGSFTDIFEDLFGDLGGNARKARRQNRGQDLRFNLEISLEESFKGRQAQITVPTADRVRNMRMAAVRGSGLTKPSSARPVPALARFARSRASSPSSAPVLPAAATASIIKNPCKSCKGAGQVQKERTLTVDIPAGVEEGTRIRLSGEGQGGLNGGPPGDLYIFIALAPHPIFQRDGHDLYCRAPVSFVTASLGGDIEVPTVDGGRAKVAIPEGTQSGRQFACAAKACRCCVAAA